ncbi:hypothetical protein FGL54_19040 [Enterobacter cloacae]|nr:hypothetical protein FGL54_19040 [Enterobacter cloacae]RXX49867.1 hypothetical protein DD604_11165 [Enterobacter cloacae]
MRRRRCRPFRHCCKKKPGGATLTGLTGFVGRVRRSRHPAKQTARCYCPVSVAPPGKDRRELNQTLQPINPLQRLTWRQ